MGLRDIFDFQLSLMTTQMVDSELETTRIFWRRKVGFDERIVSDPRPLCECLDAAELIQEDE